MKTIAIIGGGFSGTMAAVNLARFSEVPLRIVLINAKRPLGRGTAYGTRRLEHLLNVAARNMSALADEPTHFVQWLRTRGEYDEIPENELREMFIPRRLYGDYLRSLSLGFLRPIEPRGFVEIEVIEKEAVDILAPTEGVAAIIVLEDGDQFEADQVLLATGNQPPASLPGTLTPEKTPSLPHTCYCDDPWSDWQSNLPADTNEEILLLGTGLTMVDVFLTLSALDWKGQITVVSRNGLIPQSHFRGIEYPDYLEGESETLSLDRLLEIVETHCQILRDMKANPAIAVDKLRPHTQRLWKGLSVDEKREFLAKHVARWNVTRHRIAQSIHQQLTTAIDEGRLRVVQGTITGVHAAGDRVSVTLDKAPTLEARFVMNCTGPQSRFSKSNVPLLQNLLRRGHLHADAMDMGIDVGEDFSVLDEEGENSSWLYAMGPLLKGTLWETIAVPEIRGQALRVAQILMHSQLPVEIEEEYVLEYYI